MPYYTEGTQSHLLRTAECPIETETWIQIAEEAASQLSWWLAKSQGTRKSSIVPLLIPLLNL